MKKRIKSTTSFILIFCIIFSVFTPFEGVFAAINAEAESDVKTTNEDITNKEIKEFICLSNNYNGSNSVLEFRNDERELVTESLPQTLSVLLGNDEITEIPVSWHCDDDIVNTQYDYYVFEALPGDGYVLSNKLQSRYDNGEIVLPIMEVRIINTSTSTSGMSSRASNVARYETTYYTTVEEALNLAVWCGGGTVYILSNASMDQYYLGYNAVTIMPEGGNWTLSYKDLDGDSTGIISDPYAVDGTFIGIQSENPTTLTLSGNGNYTLTIDASPPSNAATGKDSETGGTVYTMMQAILVKNGSSLNVKSGVCIKGASSYLFAAGVNVLSGGAATFSGGEIKNCNMGIFVSAGSTVSITGGSYHDCLWGALNQGTLTIKDGAFYNNSQSGVMNNNSGSTATISGGSYYNNGSGLYNASGATLSISACNSYTNTYGIENYGTLKMGASATVNSNNPIYLAKGTYIEVTSAFNKDFVGDIQPEEYTLLTNLVYVTYSGATGSTVSSKFSTKSSDSTYCAIPSGQYLVLSREYTVTYNGNGATTGSTASNTAIYNQSFLTTPNGFKRIGYTFNGWAKTAEGPPTDGWGLNSSGVYESGTSWVWSRTEDLNLYAQWTHNEYTVTYNANGGSTPNFTKNYYYADAVDLSPTAEKAGMIFVGWSTDPNATKPLNSLSMPDLATSTNTSHSDWELTLYAVYTIPVSDVANHTYPDYKQEKEEEVYFVVWDKDDTSTFRTYPLSYKYDVNRMVYKYTLDTTDISSFVSGIGDYCYQIIAFDNAGNHAVLHQGTNTGGNPIPPENFPVPQRYMQTVYHYKYDILLKEWVKFDTTTALLLEGETFTPAYITPPEGYKTHDITYPAGYVISDEGSYVVKESETSNAFYMPMNYKITFDANGGTCNVKEKTVTYNDYYGTLPIPAKEGHTFIGWYTEASGGTQVLSSHKYLEAKDSTLYAHWEVNAYNVTYDYWTNGGSSTSLFATSIDYGGTIDLGVTAHKDGWDFVGWNTDSQATTGLSSITMQANDVVLYAIYKKDITITIIEQSDSGQKTRSLSKTIYNNENSAAFSMTVANEWADWTLLGWTAETGAEEYPIVGIGNEFYASEDITLYGLYTSTVTLSYDTNGASMVINNQTKDSYYNASGDSAYPAFVIEDGPILSQHSFVNWRDIWGSEYTPDESVIFDKDTLLTANWDKHPEIEAYDRYFTIEEAQQGEITETELLEKVTATDQEDGILENGTDVIVKDYNTSEFTGITSDETVEITYSATDSFGNVIEKTVTVHVVDTSVKESAGKRFIRFISSRFYADEEGNLLTAEEGGLQNTSVWRTDEENSSLLESALFNTKVNEEYKNIEYFGTSTEVKIAGSGEWQTEKSTWVFTKDDIKDVKEFVDTHGYGNIKEPNALELFIESFRKCLKFN